MSVMFEVQYARPQDMARESRITNQIIDLGGRLDFREESEIPNVSSYVCLTYEFDDWDRAEIAARALRAAGEHVDGPMNYGD